VSFRTRLVLAAAYLLAAVVLALEIPLALNVERRAESEFRSNVLGRAAVVAARVADLVPAGGVRFREAPARLRDVVRETAGGTEERILVSDSRGRVLVDTSGDARPGTLYATSGRPEFAAALGGRIDSRRRFSETLGEELLLVTVPVVDRDRVVGTVRVSAPTGSLSATVRESWLRLAFIGAAVVAAGLLLAWVLATSLARPVGRLARAADRLGRGELEARASPEGPAELAALARSFNRMAGALASSLTAQRDFVANASHQLRTPLTGLRLRLEAIREEGGWTGEQAAKAEAELDRLSGLVDDLLELARASSPEATGRTVDLGVVARQAVERWRDRAQASGKRLHLADGRPATVWANEADLAHVLDNLVENAVRYCPPGTEIAVEVGERAGRATLIVSDSGPGIAPEDRPRVFERFYRGADGRRAGAGTGLGLAIVAELVGRWGGAVRLLDGPGTRIEAEFPRVPTVP
jgi:signal transduction histidine kinase